MIITTGLYFGHPCALVCDARCEKAWGVNNRPKVQHDPNIEDDTSFLADNELGDAPADPGTYEGGHSKPSAPVHNKWCWRECERAAMYPPEPGQGTHVLTLPDFSRRHYNMSHLHRDEEPS